MSAMVFVCVFNMCSPRCSDLLHSQQAAVLTTPSISLLPMLPIEQIKPDIGK